MAVDRRSGASLVHPFHFLSRLPHGVVRAAHRASRSVGRSLLNPLGALMRSHTWYVVVGVLVAVCHLVLDPPALFEVTFRVLERPLRHAVLHGGVMPINRVNLVVGRTLQQL